MRIYFAGIGKLKEEIKYTDNDRFNEAIINALREVGHEVVEDVRDLKRFEKDVKHCSAFAFEATGTSTYLGYIVCSGELLGIPEYAFYDKTQERKVSFMLLGNPYVKKLPYVTDGDIRHLVNEIQPPQIRVIEQRRMDNKWVQ